MGVPRFPIPADTQEMLRVLNASNTWGLSIVERGGRFHVLTGDQLAYTADTRQDAEAFLAGCFLATYSGKSLRRITEEIDGGKYSQHMDADFDLIWDERRERTLRSAGDGGAR